MRFGGLTAVNNVSIAVARGEIRAIIGPNGAGKSTFLQLPHRRARPTSGHIYLNDEDVAGLPPERGLAQGLARSYQITNILPGATVLENVRVAAQSRRHAWNMLRNRYAFPDLMDKARAVLDAVGLRNEEDELAANLSHGAQRNLEIGIALATEPQLLCLDEPTAGMSVTETHCHRRAGAPHRRNLTIVIVEHDMEVVMGLASTITVLDYGEVLAEGTRRDPGQSAGAGGLSQDLMLTLDNVHTHYGKSHILHGVSIDVQAGEVVGLLGRNGVGKSTTLKTVMGLVRPSRAR
jgi:ABC-type branched-subunit amino acid transport system ATPase component